MQLLHANLTEFEENFLLFVQHQYNSQQLENKIIYSQLGTVEFFKKTCRTLSRYMKVKCDGVQIDLPAVEGITLINIPSQCGGSDFWGNSEIESAWKKQNSNDQVIEIVGMKDAYHLGRCIMGLAEAIKICQGSNITICIDAPYPIPMQIDGEPYQLGESKFEITFNVNGDVKIMKNCTFEDDTDMRFLKILGQCVKENIIDSKQMEHIKKRLMKIE